MPGAGAPGPLRRTCPSPCGHERELRRAERLGAVRGLQPEASGRDHVEPDVARHRRAGSAPGRGELRVAVEGAVHAQEVQRLAERVRGSPGIELGHGHSLAVRPASWTIEHACALLAIDSLLLAGGWTHALHHLAPILVLGGTGKTGRRVVDRLRARGVPSASARARARRASTGTTAPRGAGARRRRVGLRPRCSPPCARLHGGLRGRERSTWPIRDRPSTTRPAASGSPSAPRRRRPAARSSRSTSSCRRAAACPGRCTSTPTRRSASRSSPGRCASGAAGSGSPQVRGRSSSSRRACGTTSPTRATATPG